MGERENVLGRTETSWVDARLWVPDSPRKVVVLWRAKNSHLMPMEARWAGGAWRFINDRHAIPRDGAKVRVWKDIPWWDRYAEESKSKAAAAKPAGAKARAESEAEAQAARRPHGRNAREASGLSQAESDFAPNAGGTRG